MKKHWLVIWLILCIPLWGWNQSVGVVLSGGGAKGLLHIGVLKALEEKGIPIDYIAGTSMGAIIAGLYAEGYSPDEMKEIFESDEINLWISGDIESKYMYFFKKTQPSSTWIQLSFDLKLSHFDPKLPTNLISPHQMDLAFVEIMGAADAASHGNFDSLMIPFRCNATNITRHEEVVFSKGPLKDAVRASMSFPFVFKPLIIDSCILYDGGMMNNFPLHIMKEDFQPDYVIGVVASDMFSSQPSEDDIVSIIESMITTPNRTDPSFHDKGIILSPPIPSDLGVTDFEKGLPLIQEGYEYTMKYIDSIRKDVSRTFTPFQAHMRRMKFRTRMPDLCIGNVKINGLTPFQEKIIKPILLKDKEVVHFDEFKKRYSKLMQEERIESIYPHITYDSLHQYYHMNLDLKQKKPFTAKFGGHISTGTYTTFYGQLLYQTLDVQSVSAGVDGFVGRYYNAAVGFLRLDYYQQSPFYQVLKFGAQRWNYFNTDITLLREESSTFLIQKNQFFEYSLAFPISRSAKWMTGVDIFKETDKYYHTNNISDHDINDINRFKGIRPFIEFEYNTTDFTDFATQGLRLYVNGNYQNGSEVNIPGTTSQLETISEKRREWININAIASALWPLGRYYRIGFYAHAALSNQPMFTSYTATLMRSNTFAPTPESSIAYLPQFRNPNFAAAGINNILIIRKKLQLRMDTYYFQPFCKVEEIDESGVQQKIVLEDFSMLFYASLAYPTRFGPLAMSFSLYPQSGKQKIETLFNISFGYLLFEHKIY